MRIGDAGSVCVYVFRVRIFAFFVFDLAGLGLGQEGNVVSEAFFKTIEGS